METNGSATSVAVERHTTSGICGIIELWDVIGYARTSLAARVLGDVRTLCVLPFYSKTIIIIRST